MPARQAYSHIASLGNEYLALAEILPALCSMLVIASQKLCESFQLTNVGVQFLEELEFVNIGNHIAAQIQLSEFEAVLNVAKGRDMIHCQREDLY